MHCKVITQPVKKYAIKHFGFTLIEILVVIGIVAILALATIPSQVGRFNQKRIAETIELAQEFKQSIQGFYQINGKFPVDNAEAGMPEPEKILGNYLEGLEVLDGVMHLQLGNKLTRFKGQTVSIFPVFVEGSPTSPISWVCGHGSAPEGMTMAGENKTSINSSNLPLSCR